MRQNIILEQLRKMFYHKLNPNVKDPEYATEKSACFDICAYLPRDGKVQIISPDNYCHSIDSREHFILKPLERALVPTGLIFDISDGASVRLHPRSCLAIKNGLTLINCEGVVDEDYVQEVFIPVINFSHTAIMISNGDRIAQAEVVPVYRTPLMATDKKPETKTDRVGGFGSTGVSSKNKEPEQLTFSFK